MGQTTGKTISGMALDSNFYFVHQILLKIRNLFDETEDEIQVYWYCRNDNFEIVDHGGFGSFKDHVITAGIELFNKHTFDLVNLLLGDIPTMYEDGSRGKLSFDYETLEFKFEHFDIELTEKLYPVKTIRYEPEQRTTTCD